MKRLIIIFTIKIICITLIGVIYIKKLQDFFFDYYINVYEVEVSSYVTIYFIVVVSMIAFLFLYGGAIKKFYEKIK